MVLAIDAGNTRIKAAVFEGYSLVEQIVFAESDFSQQIAKILEAHPAVCHVVGAFVGRFTAADVMHLNDRAHLTLVDHHFDFPFENQYKTPKTLGIDRMVLASGAVLKYPDADRLVIDAGTCITYDYVDHRNVYHGGAISPGLSMRYKSLHHYTARLPELEPAAAHALTGGSTAESIHSGIVNGVVFEIDGFIDSYRLNNPNIIIILTGGDAVFLANRLKNTIFANSNFLLESLNQTHQYKLQND